MAEAITYGPGGYDPEKPDNNVVERHELPDAAPTLEDALVNAARLAMTSLVKGGTLADVDVAAIAPLYNPWRVGESVQVGDLRSWDGTVVECLQAHTTQADWTPGATPALWKVHRTTTGDTPDAWVQPQGSHDAYSKGDKVTHSGQVWESLIDANVWEPGAPGTASLWKQVG